MAEQKWGLAVIIEGEVLEQIRKAIVFPITEATLMEEPQEINKKASDYEEGKKLFLSSVRVMAEALLPKLSPDSKKLILTMSVEETKDMQSH